MYTFLGITLVLALLLTINATATMVCRRLRHVSANGYSGNVPHAHALKYSSSCASDRRCIAIVAIAAFMIPSYLTYEPHTTNEIVSWKLGSLAMLSAIGVGLAIWRGLRSWLATRSLLKDWLAASTRIELEAIHVPTFVSGPLISDHRRGRRVSPATVYCRSRAESLTEEELAAAIAHEYGHLAARRQLQALGDACQSCGVVDHSVWSFARSRLE